MGALDGVTDGAAVVGACVGVPEGSPVVGDAVGGHASSSDQSFPTNLAGL